MKFSPLLLLSAVAALSLPACAPEPEPHRVAYGPTYNGYYGGPGYYGGDGQYRHTYQENDRRNENDVNIDRTNVNERTVNRTNVNQTDVNRTNVNQTNVNRSNGNHHNAGTKKVVRKDARQDDSNNPHP